MFDYYLIYEKTDNAKYISHLDFVRAYNRTMRRAKLPTAFSEGFNPHPILGFALPLSVGYTSQCELLEFRLTHEMEEDSILQRLNDALPDGIKILSVHKGKSNMKKLRYALYRVSAENLPRETQSFTDMESIVTEKKTKSGIKKTDIRGDIVEIRITGDSMEMLLSAGSERNLKPDVVVKAMNEYIEGYNSGECEYHRVAIYDCDMNEIK